MEYPTLQIEYRSLFSKAKQEEMEISTSWVKPPNTIGGLDHLAVQAPCINLYGRMLPGITNVTDRARYYSFYPWVVWSLEKRGHVYGDLFIDLFRKADCLFTLIANRHASVSGGDRDDHAGAAVGSNNMYRQNVRIQECESISLSYSARREGENRYFKNKLGGLGQYYLRVFREVKLMDGDLQSGIKNIREFGGVLAEALDRSVNGDLFFKTIAEDTVSASRLDELSSFCPCFLVSSSTERGTRRNVLKRGFDSLTFKCNWIKRIHMCFGSLGAFSDISYDLFIFT